MVGLGGMPEASKGCVRATYFKEETLRHVPCWNFFAGWAEGVGWGKGCGVIG